MFAAGTNQLIHFSRAAAVNFSEHAAEEVRRKLSDFVKTASCVIEGRAWGVIHREPQVQPSSRRRCGLRIRNGLAERCRQAIPPPDDAEPHAFIDAMRRFGEKVFVEQTQNGLDLGGRTLPIRGGKREKCQSVNADSRRSLNDAARRLRSRAVPGGARPTARTAPSATSAPAYVHVVPLRLGDGRLRRGNLRYRLLMHEHALSPPPTN